MKVSEALETRKTCRSFLDKPVPKEMLEEILTTAMRAPSGGNLQPWRIYALTGDVRTKIIDTVKERMPENPMGEGAEYEIYPPNLTEPYKSRRRQVGESMYNVLGIPREDKMARLVWFARNFEFFECPTALVFTVDRQMQEGQWSDVGMFMQSICLLAREYGLHTAAQEAWAVWTKTLVKILDIPDNEMVFCSLAIGWEDTSHPISAFRTDRAPLEEVVSFHGFEG